MNSKMMRLRAGSQRLSLMELIEIFEAYPKSIFLSVKAEYRSKALTSFYLHVRSQVV